MLELFTTEIGVMGYLYVVKFEFRMGFREIHDLTLVSIR